MTPCEQDDLIQAIALSPVAMVISNPRHEDNPLEFVNTAFRDLTGYSENEIIGRNCRFLAGVDTQTEASAQLRASIWKRQPALVELINYRRDGTPFRNGVMVTPLLDPEEGLAWFFGSQVELPSDDPEGLWLRRAKAARCIAKLPPRQRQVLQAMAHGLLNKQIAWKLKISEKTVKMHRAALLESLDVRSSAEAIRIAIEGGL